MLRDLCAESYIIDAHCHRIYRVVALQRDGIIDQVYR